MVRTANSAGPTRSIEQSAKEMPAAIRQEMNEIALTPNAKVNPEVLTCN
jgi:hypothetical protein